jgi:hypothetical protein
LRFDETLIKDTKTILGAKTETEMIEVALSDAIYQDKMRIFIEQTKGKFKFRGFIELEGNSYRHIGQF